MVPEGGHPGRARDQLFEEGQPLGGQLARYRGHPRDVSAGPRQARREPELDGVGTGRGHDGNDAGRLLGRERCGVARGHQDVDLGGDELGGQALERGHLSVSPPRVKDDVLAFDVPQLA